MRLFRGELGSIDDEGDLQTTTILGPYGEELTKVHRVMPYGLHSMPPVGSHGLGLQLGSEGRVTSAMLGLEHQQYRPKKRPGGSVALYDQNDNVISLVQQELRVTGKKATIVEAADKVTIKRGGLVVVLREGRIDLGAEEGTQAVMTAGGPSSVVFAKV